MGTNHIAPYDITVMINGWYRAECLLSFKGEMCGFHSDHSRYEDAYRDLRSHMATHKMRVQLPRSERAVS